MIKKFSKFLFTLLLITMFVSSFSVCFADVNGDKTKSATPETTSIQNTSEDNSSTDEATQEETIHNGDLYLFDTDVVMDKLVDGNVFILGNNVEITGQVNGNLFVCANTVKFNQSYIRYSIFACANSIYYNGACNDLYVATNNLEMTYDSYVVRDLKSAASNIIIKAAIGRDADLIFNKIDLGEDQNIPIIYGNLRYTSNSEVSIPDGVITDKGTVTYIKSSNNKNIAENITDILVGFLVAIATVLVIYALTKRFTPQFTEKISNKKLSILNILKYFVIGLITCIVVVIVAILLLITTVCAKLALILATSFFLLVLISLPAFTISITHSLKPILKIEKTSMFYLILVLVSIILYGVTLIPFVGFIFAILIKLVAVGTLIDMYLPHKELSEEEKKAINEAKQQAKAEKEKRKKEKAEAKETKKQEKAKLKENKKEDK